jgi:hypothetical protein
MHFASDHGAGALDCSLNVRVGEVTYLGETLIYTLVTNWGQRLSVRQALGAGEDHRPVVDAETVVRWRSADSHVFNASG